MSSFLFWMIGFLMCVSPCFSTSSFETSSFNNLNLSKEMFPIFGQLNAQKPIKELVDQRVTTQEWIQEITDMTNSKMTTYNLETLVKDLQFVRGTESTLDSISLSKTDFLAKYQEILKELAITHKKDWLRITRIFNKQKELCGQKFKQEVLQQYYNSHIKISSSKKGEKFSLKEDGKLYELVKKHNEDWSEIYKDWPKINKDFPGRDYLSLRNRYHCLLKKHKMKGLNKKFKHFSQSGHLENTLVPIEDKAYPLNTFVDHIEIQFNFSALSNNP